jgi:hypothetical protein
MPAMESSLGQEVEDIAQIVSLSSPGEDGRRELEFSISRYISKLRKPCPTPGCNHGLTRGVAVCSGYESEAIIIGSGSGRQSPLSFEETSHRDEKSHPLVIPVFCFVFSELLGHSEKEVCKRCREESFSYKRKFDGLYCHGCGFFVDYENRIAGYSGEWTTSSELPTRLDIKCSYCETAGVSTKFGDYWFCTPFCMQSWYLSGGGGCRAKKEKDEAEGRISFLR